MRWLNNFIEQFKEISSRRIGYWVEIDGDFLVRFNRANHSTEAIVQSTFDIKTATRITTHKESHGSFDTIYLTFDASDGSSMTLGDEDPAWSAVTAVLAKFDGIDDSWYDRVSTSPIESSSSVIYNRTS